MSMCCHPRHARFADAADTGEGHSHPCRGGAPLPLKALAVGGAFLLYPPLGVATLAYMVLRHRRGGGDFVPSWGRRGFRRGFWSTGNAAFDAERVETLKRMAEEAQAFDDFRRREHEARDRETLDRFKADRAAAPAAAATPGTTPAPEGPTSV